MAVRYGTLVRYVTLQFLLRGTVRWYGTPFLEWYGYGTLVRYALKIELKYGTLVRYGLDARYVVQIPNVPYRTAILGPWSLASSIPVLGLEIVCPRKGCPWPWPRIFFVSLALASSLVSSTPPL